MRELCRAPLFWFYSRKRVSKFWMRESVRKPASECKWKLNRMWTKKSATNIKTNSWICRKEKILTQRYIILLVWVLRMGAISWHGKNEVIFCFINYVSAFCYHVIGGMLSDDCFLFLRAEILRKNIQTVPCANKVTD